MEPPAGATVRTVTEGPTRLPCQFDTDGQKVVQVSWSKAGPDGSKDTVIAAHHSDGHTGKSLAVAPCWRAASARDVST